MFNAKNYRLQWAYTLVQYSSVGLIYYPDSPEDVHLRWGLTYIPIWTALLSPIALMIAARKSKRKLVIRLYSALIGIGLWLIAIFLQVIGGDIFLPSTCFCKDVITS